MEEIEESEASKSRSLISSETDRIESDSEALVEEEVMKESGISFARILGKSQLLIFQNLILYTVIHWGIGLVVFLVFYIIGMSYKLYTIYKGTYTESEPVFLKYK